MIHRKVRMPCGLFDTVGPGYGRARFRQDGPLQAGPSERMDIPERGRGQGAELAALADRRRFIRDCTRHPGLAGPSGGPRLVDHRPPRFVNRPIWA